MTRSHGRRDMRRQQRTETLRRREVRAQKYGAGR